MSDLVGRALATPSGSGAKLAAFSWGLLGAAVAILMAPLEPSFLEEGLMLHVAERIVGGEHLYRDVLAVTGPVPYEMLAAGFRLFGSEIWVARGFIVLLQALSTGLIFDWVRRSGGGPLAHVAAGAFAAAPVLLFPLYTLFFYTTVAGHFCVMAAYAVLRSLEAVTEGSVWRWGVAGGVAVALAALSKQTVGLALAISLVVAVVACAPAGRRGSRLVPFGVGGLAVTLVTLSLYAFRGELAIVFDSLVLRPLSLGETYQSPYMNLWPPGEFSDSLRSNRFFYIPQLYNLFTASVFAKVKPWLVLVTQLCFALPPLAILATALLGAFRRLPSGAWVHAALLLALATNLFPRSDWGHLVAVLPASIIQLVLLAAPAPGRSLSRGARRLVAAVAALMLMGIGVGTGLSADGIYRVSKPSGLGPRVPQRPVSTMVRNGGSPRVVDFLRERVTPGEAIFVARSEPLIYFATGTTNPTRYGGIITGHREEQEPILLEALSRVRFVVMSDRDQALYTWYSDEVPAVQAFLERHFEVPPEFIGVDDRDSWIYALQRGPDRGETLVDFFDRRAEGQYWVRRRSGSVDPVSEVPPRLAAHYNRRPLGFPVDLRGGGVDFKVVVPEGALFQGDVGLKGMISESDIFSLPPKSTISVSIRREGEAAFTKLHEEPILQRDRLLREGSFWTPVEIDLAKYAGEHVTLRLALDSDLFIRPGSLAWFGSPRLAAKPVAR